MTRSPRSRTPYAQNADGHVDATEEEELASIFATLEDELPDGDEMHLIEAGIDPASGGGPVRCSTIEASMRVPIG